MVVLNSERKPQESFPFNLNIFERPREERPVGAASNSVHAFLNTAVLEAAETPWPLSLAGGTLGSYFYYKGIGRSLVGNRSLIDPWIRAAEKIRITNLRFLGAAAAGMLAASLLYALRPNLSWGEDLFQRLNIRPNRTWEAARNKTLYGGEGDLYYAGAKALAGVLLLTVGIGIFARQIVAIPSFFFRTPIRYSPFREPVAKFARGVGFHVRGIGQTVVQMKNGSGGFIRSLSTKTPWNKMGGWFLSPESKLQGRLRPLAFHGLRAVRIGGVLGLGLNVADRFLTDETKEEIAGYQTARMIGGVLMNLALVEFTITTMGLIRFGAYLNAASEFVIDYRNQQKTTEPQNFSFFRTALPIFRTAIYKKALDVSLNLVRARKLGLLPGVGENWFSQTLTNRLQKAVGSQTAWGRSLSSLEATPIATTLIVIPYALEAFLGRANLANFAYARTEQNIWPAIPMIFVASWTGNFTSLASILFSKFFLNFTFGQASWNCHGRYSGDKQVLKDFVSDLREIDPGRSDYAEAVDRVIHYYMVKKMGHVEGGIGSFGNFLTSRDRWYDQISGYVRAVKYSLSDKDQPLGSFLGYVTGKGIDWVHAVFGGERIANPFSKIDTLFTPDEDAYLALYEAMHDPAKYGLGKEDPPFLLKQLSDYLDRHATDTLQRGRGNTRKWEDWTLARSIAIMAAVGGMENEEVRQMRSLAAQYLKGTEEMATEERLKAGWQRLTEEAVGRSEGRTQNTVDTLTPSL